MHVCIVFLGIENLFIFKDRVFYAMYLDKFLVILSNISFVFCAVNDGLFFKVLGVLLLLVICAVDLLHHFIFRYFDPKYHQHFAQSITVIFKKKLGLLLVFCTVLSFCFLLFHSKISSVFSAVNNGCFISLLLANIFSGYPAG